MWASSFCAPGPSAFLLSQRDPPACDTIWRMVDGPHHVPPHLLQAVAEQTGRIALVVGAGCSLESPTSLELSDEYARQVHAQLVVEHVLDSGDCANPNDLSAVTSAVWSKVESQEPVVTRLPRGAFRDAQANDGYLTAAALLREGSVSAVLTLNFDLAMSDALGQLSANDEVAVIASPAAVGDLGSRVLVYLHRNANEDNFDEWTLRVESLTDEWKGRWEEVLSQRVLSSPVVVFAGLGSPAAVLTESITWIRSCIEPGHHHTYVVDPAATTSFQTALELPDDAHIRMGWCEFMAHLDDRLSDHLRTALEESCRELCTSHSWDNEAASISSVCDAFYKRGLVASGKQRARWLLHKRSYLSDSEHIRGFIAYLLLGIGLVQRQPGTDVTVRHDGVVELLRENRVVGSCLPVSGEGTHHWTAIEPRVKAVLKKMEAHEIPSAILIAGLQGPAPSEITPPEDVGCSVVDGDIIGGDMSPLHITVDELRADPTLAARVVV